MIACMVFSIGLVATYWTSIGEDLNHKKSTEYRDPGNAYYGGERAVGKYIVGHWEGGTAVFPVPGYRRALTEGPKDMIVIDPVQRSITIDRSSKFRLKAQK